MKQYTLVKHMQFIQASYGDKLELKDDLLNAYDNLRMSCFNSLIEILVSSSCFDTSLEIRFFKLACQLSMKDSATPPSFDASSITLETKSCVFCLARDGCVKPAV